MSMRSEADSRKAVEGIEALEKRVNDSLEEMRKRIRGIELRIKRLVLQGSSPYDEEPIRVPEGPPPTEEDPTRPPERPPQCAEAAGPPRARDAVKRQDKRKPLEAEV